MPLYHSSWALVLGKPMNFKPVFMAMFFLLLEWAYRPFRAFVTIIHELGHAAAAWATGGHVVEVHWNLMDGAVVIRHGIPVIILFAGYATPMVLFAGLTAICHQRTGLKWLAIILWAAAISDLISDGVWGSATQSDLAQLSNLTGFSSGLWVLGHCALSAITWYMISRGLNRPTSPNPSTAASS